MVNDTSPTLRLPNAPHLLPSLYASPPRTPHLHLLPSVLSCSLLSSCSRLHWKKKASFSAQRSFQSLWKMPPCTQLVALADTLGWGAGTPNCPGNLPHQWGGETFKKNQGPLLECLYVGTSPHLVYSLSLGVWNLNAVRHLQKTPTNRLPGMGGATESESTRLPHTRHNQVQFGSEWAQWRPVLNPIRPRRFLEPNLQPWRGPGRG